MKKQLVLFVLLCAAMVMSAQEMTGRWKATEVDKGMEAVSTFDLKAGGEAAVSMLMNIKEEQDGVGITLWVRVEAPATWTTADGKVKVTIAKKGDIQTESDVDIAGIDPKEAKSIKKLYGIMGRMMMKEMVKELRGETISLLIQMADDETVLVEEEEKPATYHRQ